MDMKIRMDGVWVTWGWYLYFLNLFPNGRVPGTWRNSINIYIGKNWSTDILVKPVSYWGMALRTFFFYFLPGLFWWSNKDVCLLVWKIKIFSGILLHIPKLGVTHLFSLPLYHNGSSKTREDILSFWCCFLLHTNLYLRLKLQFEFDVSSMCVMSSVK